MGSVPGVCCPRHGTHGIIRPLCSTRPLRGTPLSVRVGPSPCVTAQNGRSGQPRLGSPELLRAAACVSRGNMRPQLCACRRSRTKREQTTSMLVFRLRPPMFIARFTTQGGRPRDRRTARHGRDPSRQRVANPLQPPEVSAGLFIQPSCALQPPGLASGFARLTPATPPPPQGHMRSDRPARQSSSASSSHPPVVRRRLLLMVHGTVEGR